MTDTNLAIRPASQLPLTSGTQLIKPFPSIQDDIQLQQLITESKRIGIELERHLPITCIETPLGEFVNPREVYLKVATQQKQSRELVVSKAALNLLKEYTENVMARIIRLSEFLQEQGICPNGKFEKVFNSKHAKETIEVSFMPGEHFKGYCFRITTIGEESSDLMFNIAFMKHPQVVEFSQGLFAGSRQAIQRGNSEYISLQLDKGFLFLDSQLRHLSMDRRKIVAGETVDDVTTSANLFEITTPGIASTQVALLES